MRTFVEITTVFILCGVAGWILEVIYRSTKARSLINPGFLVGCLLPIYGCGGLILYRLCRMDVSFISVVPLRILFLIVCGACLMTLIELFGGFVFLRVLKTRLWDYSGEWGNLDGLICPKFSFFWGVCCALYYFLLDKPLVRLVTFLSASPAAWFCIGICFGVFLVDLCVSLDLATRVRAYAAHLREVVNIERLRTSARTRLVLLHRPHHYRPFMFRLHSAVRSFLNEKKQERESTAESAVPSPSTDATVPANSGVAAHVRESEESATPETAVEKPAETVGVSSGTASPQQG